MLRWRASQVKGPQAGRDGGAIPYRVMVAGMVDCAAWNAVARLALAARTPVRASSIATDRKIKPSVSAPTVIWLANIQRPSWAPKTWVAPYAKYMRAPTTAIQT